MSVRPPSRSPATSVLRFSPPPTRANITCCNDLGVDPGHIASSRTLDFVDAFRRRHRWAGHGRRAQQPQRRLRRCFAATAAPRRAVSSKSARPTSAWPATSPHPIPESTISAYDLSSAPAESLQRAWTALTEMFAAGVLKPLPTTSYGLLNAPQAFRDMSQARHTGKIVLIPPAVLDPEGTVLITGGTGMLGALFAEHLVTRYGVGHLLLVSRSGPDAPGASELQQRLAGLGAQVAITACDTSDPAELAAALDTIAASHPLTAVIHTAGVLDDAVVSELSPPTTRYGLGRQSRRRLASASPHRRPRPGRVRLVLLGRGNTGQPRAGQLRGRQRIPGRAGPPPPSHPTPRHQCGLGLLANPRRHDRPPRHDRADPPDRHRPDPDHQRARPGPLRRRTAPVSGPTCWPARSTQAR